ncbi:hypothetical protein [Paludisphaera sp.]|uniref:hypothetical protein n=1 Tax=Paludisphaera sp. TaxID=2017432 RepID=UPI00301C3B13
MDAWKKLRSLFDTDDGSLPEIRLAGLSRDGVARVFDLIRSRATLDSDAVFWHRALDREELLGAHRDPAGMVASGEAEPFHFVASGISAGGTILPDLGVFVFSDEVALDYRMGPEWGEAELGALFELLRILTAAAPEARVELDDHGLPEVERLFLDEWAAYCRAATHSSPDNDPR